MDTSVAACVPFYGVYDLANVIHPPEEYPRYDDFLERMVFKTPQSADPQRYADASPLLLVRPDAPPFFVIHGTNDSLVDVAEAREFVNRLRAVSRSPVAYAELPGAQHAFDIFASVRGTAVVNAVETFLTWARGQAP
jgi:acetyl esterase/lipase